MMKSHIERNTVQETLLIPLYSRMRAAMIFPDVYEDEATQGVIDRIDYDFSSVKKAERKTLYRFGFLEVAMRQNDLAAEIEGYLASHPAAAVVNFGCGLDDTGKRCDNGECKIYNIDFENVMEIRNALLCLPGSARKTSRVTLTTYAGSIGSTPAGEPCFSPPACSITF